MRAPSDMPNPAPRSPRRSGGSNRRRIVLVIAVVALIIFFTSLRGIAGFYTDYLWFDSLGYRRVWSGMLGAKVALAVIFVTIFFVLCWINLYIADRLAPDEPPPGPEQEVFDRFNEVVGSRIGLLRIGIALLLALIAGVGMGQEWEAWLLFINGGSWGLTDPQFGTDIGFYMFTLPFLSSVADWAFASILIILIATLAAHFVNGGIRIQPTEGGQVTGFGPKVTPQVKAHLSVLLGVLALIRAGGYYLERFELTTSTRGVVDGAAYTDVNAQLPVLNLLILISVASFVLFIVNIWRRGWVLPILAVGLWGLVAVVAAGIYPRVIQQFQVNPNELTRESEFIERNIAATRHALDLHEVRTVDYELSRDAADVDLTDKRETIENIRLWDPSPPVLGQTFPRLERLLPYYAMNDVDIDRYTIDGDLKQVVLSVRDLNTDEVPSSSWEARHVVFTHGYGVVMASGTEKTPQGRPVFNLQQVPVQANNDVEVSRPQIYFGENLSGYVVTGTDRQELDYQIGDESVFTEYTGDDGVGIGSFVNRIAFSLRFGDYNPLITGLINGDSKIHYIRDIRDRASTLAPFLSFDADPYPVVDSEGHVKWILDAYTTSDKYPYGQRADNSGLPSATGLDSRLNYVRNSVKTVIDAYDGTVDFYVVDDEDPIIRAWSRAFPDLFSDFDEMPEDLVPHLRYPEDLFRLQTNMWGQYHVSNPDTFYNQNDAWNVSLDPGTTGAELTTQPTDADGNPVTATSGRRMDPYYLLMELPEEDETEFVILRPFVPIGADQNQQMVSFMVARSDPEHYGELVTYTMPRQNRPDGPAIVADAMQSDETVSAQQTLLGQGGSEVKMGNLILVPVDGALVYVRPFYVESDQVQIPELKTVIVFFESEVAVDETLEGALTQIFGDVPDLEEVVDEGGEPVAPDEVDGGVDDDEPQVPTGSVNDQVAQLLEEAQALFVEAEDALADGNLGEYQTKSDEGRAKTSEAMALIAETTTTTVPTPDADDGDGDEEPADEEPVEEEA